MHHNPNQNNEAFTTKRDFRVKTNNFIGSPVSINSPGTASTHLTRSTYIFSPVSPTTNSLKGLSSPALHIKQLCIDTIPPKSKNHSKSQSKKSMSTKNGMKRQTLKNRKMKNAFLTSSNVGDVTSFEKNSMMTDKKDTGVNTYHNIDTENKELVFSRNRLSNSGIINNNNEKIKTFDLRIETNKNIEKSKFFCNSPQETLNDSSELSFIKTGNLEEINQNEIGKKCSKQLEMVFCAKSNKDTTSHIKSLTLGRPLSGVGMGNSYSKSNGSIVFYSPDQRLLTEELSSKRPSTSIRLSKKPIQTDRGKLKPFDKIQGSLINPLAKYDDNISHMIDEDLKNKNNILEINYNPMLEVELLDLDKKPDTLNHIKDEKDKQDDKDSNIEDNSKDWDTNKDEIKVSDGDDIKVKEENEVNDKNEDESKIKETEFEEKIKFIDYLYEKFNTKCPVIVSSDKDNEIEKSQYDTIQGGLELKNQQEQKDGLKLSKHEFFEMKTNIEKLHKKFDAIAADDRIFNNNDMEKFEFLRANPNKLTCLELDFIRAEFKKKEEERTDIQWEKLDSILSRIKFFAKHLKHIRLSLLRHARFIEYKPGHIIFRQGDYGDLMYVILSGSVNVRTKLQNPEGVEENMLVACLYDGDSFGELAMLSTTKKSRASITNHAMLLDQLSQVKTYKQIKEELYQNKWDGVTTNHPNQHEKHNLGSISSPMRTKSEATVGGKVDFSESKDNTKTEKVVATATARAATIEVAQGISLLTIPRENFRDILLSLIQKELDQKVKVLMRLPFFEKQEPLSLLPVANNLKIQKYKMGEVVLKTGEFPSCFGIIAEGRCNVVIEYTMKRDTKTIPFIKGQMASLTNFSFGKGPTELSTRHKDSKLNDLKVKPLKTSLKTRTFDFDPVNVNSKDNTIVYKQHMLVKVLNVGDYYGTRALLYDMPSDSNQATDEFDRFKAKLSIIAETGDVEIYTIDRIHMQYVPDFLQRIIREGLRSSRDFDDYDVSYIKKNLTSWNTSVQKVAYQSLVETYSQRIKDQARSDYKKFQHITKHY